MAMDQRYDWRLSEPGETLRVEIANLEQDGEVFDATLDAAPARADRRALMRASCSRYPPRSLARAWRASTPTRCA